MLRRKKMRSVKFLTRFSLTIIIVVFSVTGLFAQNTASVSGTIKDRNEAVVAGATVILANKGSGVEKTAVTDSNGKYEFKDLYSGQYLVTVRKGGFSEHAESVSINSGESATQDFRINPGSIREEVSVTASRGLRATSEIPQTVTSIGEQEIETRRPIGIGEAYERSPSVLSTDPNPFRARPQIRGLQSNRLLITVDGERLNNPRFGADFVGVSPSLVDTSQIKQVEVVAGSGSSLYGSDAIGGTINIITKGPDRSRDGIRLDFKVDGDYGSNHNYRKGVFNFGVGSNRAAVRLNFGRFIQPNYRIGGEGITRQEVITAGNFANAAGNLVGQSVITAYPVYEVTPGQEIGNSGARGYLGSIDFMVFPSDTQDFRIRYTGNFYRDLGVPYTTLPFSTNQPNTGLSNYNKLSLRYEKRDLASWFPRISVSYYEQDYERTLEERRSGIVNGSSYAAAGPPPAPTTFTGNLSTFTLVGTQLTNNHNTGRGFDVQLNFIPWKNAIFITGVNFSNDFSRDEFSSQTIASGVVTSSISDVANTPRTTYRNVGWYNQLEFTPIKYLRLSGGVRYDNWRTRVDPTPGYPSGNLSAVFLALLPRIQASPGPLDFAGANGYTQLVAGQSISTNSNVATYNIGVTGFIPGGINPYVRYSTSFREPDLLARYLLRGFATSPLFSLPSIINTNLSPEKGRDIDVGVKVARSRYRGTFSYYRNQLEDATGTVFNSYCIPFNPAAGILGTPSFFLPNPLPFGCTAPPPGPPVPSTQHFVQAFQTVNFAEVLIRGFEFQGEVDIPLGDLGSLTPFATFSTIRATNQTPDANRVRIVQNLYNTAAPLELDGTVDDVPFYSLPDFQGSFAPRFNSAKGNWWAEYEYRYTSKITRVDPNEISFAGTTTFANFAAYRGLRKHSIRGGVKFGETMPIVLTMGVENLSNETYFQLFQPAPAAGRSFTVGMSIGWSKLLK
jgi:outer membrane receptor protein involved in Fe transport